MYNYLIHFRPVLLGAPLQLGALSARLVRLWVNPALLMTSSRIIIVATLGLNISETRPDSGMVSTYSE